MSHVIKSFVVFSSVNSDSGSLFGEQDSRHTDDAVESEGMYLYFKMFMGNVMLFSIAGV